MGHESLISKIRNLINGHEEKEPRLDGLFSKGDYVTSNGRYLNVDADFNGESCEVLSTRDCKGYTYAGEQFVTVRLNEKIVTYYANGLMKVG